MDELMKLWKNHAEFCETCGESTEDLLIKERLFVAAVVYKDCIRDLHRATQQTNPENPEITVINEHGDIESGPSLEGLKRDPGR